MERSIDRVTDYAYGKLNLGLDVTGKREDGYHLVRMVMQTVDVCDTLVIERIPGESEEVIQNKLHIPAGGLSEDEDNLALKAARRMQECFSINEAVDITLEKRIPVSAGMAGDQVCIQCRAQVAHMHVTRGRGGKTGAHFPCGDLFLVVFKPFSVFHGILLLSETILFQTILYYNLI